MYFSQKEFNIALSGGIDSGTIAWFIQQESVNLKAYTLGTEWGDEFSEARETAEYLDIPLEYIHLSREEILSAVPEVIRYFFFVHPEAIEIALVAFCLYDKLWQADPRPRTFLTGYGSDLMNAGVFCPFDHPDELHQEILKRMRKTQLSNEFNCLGPLSRQVKVHHPFWDSRVIKTA